MKVLGVGLVVAALITAAVGLVWGPFWPLIVLTVGFGHLGNSILLSQRGSRWQAVLLLDLAVIGAYIVIGLVVLGPSLSAAGKPSHGNGISDMRFSRWP